jgi:hypothetical protein
VAVVSRTKRMRRDNATRYMANFGRE